MRSFWILMLLSAGMSAPVAAADAGHGKDLFNVCVACHSDKPDAMGPSLKNVVGRKSATLEDFRYSAAMRRAQLVWDEATLRNYLADPQALVPGNRMPFPGFATPDDVSDVIAYLKTYR